MENSVRDISSCRKPTDAILSTIADLEAVYQYPVPPRHFRFRFSRYGAPIKIVDPKYPWEFHKLFSLLYTSPRPLQISPSYDTNFTSGLGPELPPQKKFVLLCFIGCEIANPARD